MFFVLVQASGTSCSYTGSPATKSIVIPYPVTTTTTVDIKNEFTYSSNDVSDTACPLTQILFYMDPGTGWMHMMTMPYSIA